MSTARIRAGPEECGAAKRHDADGPEAHDDDRRSRADVGAQRAEVSRGEDVGEEHRLLVGHALGDGQREQVGERHGHRFGLSAGEVGHRAERSRLPGAADVWLRPPGTDRRGHSR